MAKGGKEGSAHLVVLTGTSFMVASVGAFYLSPKLERMFPMEPFNITFPGRQNKGPPTSEKIRADELQENFRLQTEDGAITVTMSTEGQEELKQLLEREVERNPELKEALAKPLSTEIEGAEAKKSTKSEEKTPSR